MLSSIWFIIFIPYIFSFTTIPTENIAVASSRDFTSMSSPNTILNTDFPPISIRQRLHQKTTGLLKLVRYKNILPTTLLSFTGGYILQPSITSLLHNPSFLIGIFNTVLIMCSSMIMNDLFDMKVDKINNPKRPLITGQVTVREALVTNIVILVTIYGFTYTYLSPELRTMIHLAILNIILYTPILKKALFIKNLSCASLVGFSIYFSGLTTRTLNTPTYLQNQLLTIATRTIFFGSLFNEILLDIRDSQGDLQNGIRTIPNVFGIKKAMTFAKWILHINVFWNLFHLIQLFHWRTGLIYILCFTPIFKNVYEVRNEEITTEMIQKTVNETNMPLFGLLLYLCFLARA